ncbi:alpha/beta fold hydrolase [Actinoplanes utahensis]|uniref:Esterase n=1 Tax=Actinoplanes utahensis TaxID=1869 RepID=A0A0A6UL06_ACTUT|nr:alpha/beta hydrolase [Actinoplanes utahensis]KHD75758.1 esterase [Actinoplanes utahensis]GIF34478.1 esterase [Actinoplanes utahensis]
MTAQRLILVGGLWTDASVWDGVVARSDDAVAVSLPAERSATLDDQVAAVLAAVDAAPGRPIVVGHSAACTLAWLAADARPEKVGKVVLVGGFAVGDGDEFASFFPIEDGVMPFPGWEPFEGPDAADIDEATRAAFAANAIPVPEGVAKGIVRLTDERRFDVPVVVVCPEFSPAQAREWIAGGDAGDVAKAKHVELVDIDSGHWPMLTRPAELAELLARL